MRNHCSWLLAGLLGLPAVAAPRVQAPTRAARSTQHAARSTSSPLQRLTVIPAEITLTGPGRGQRLVVMGTRADGSATDVTDRVKLISASPKIAVVENGRVEGRADGSSTIVVRSGTLSARVPVMVKGSQQPIVYSFQNDVVPVMARLGCSAGTCHGANSGKGGFKLSLRGYAPELDFLSITRQLGGRRIAREAPEQSLFLRKPLMEVPHAGGKRLEKGSREYYALLGWIREGAPGPDDKEPRLTGLQALPGDRIYQPGEKQRVLVRATFSDGRTEDVTDRAVYRANDAGVASITEAGQIAAEGAGATAIQAKYMDRLAVLRVIVPYPQKVNPAAFGQPESPIDRAVYAKLKELNLEPGGPCTDEEFIRRVYVDALGTLPTAEETRRFLSECEKERHARGGMGGWVDGCVGEENPVPATTSRKLPAAKAPSGPVNKAPVSSPTTPTHPHTPTPIQARAALIEEVLKRPEYGSIWALKVCDVSMVRKEHMQRKNTLALNQWLTEQFQQNRPWDQLVTALVAATGSIEENPATLWWASRQQTRPNGRGWVRHYELTGEIVAQVFLGQRIQCTKCHNHPTEKYTQDDYYRFAAIFAQVNGDGRADPVPDRFLPNDPGEVRHPRTGQMMVAQPLDHADLKLEKTDDRRVKFAEWMTHGAGQEMFARNIVNRVWARLFGSGIVDPVDDLRSTNPPKNEALLDVLAKDLIAHGYDLKYLMGAIMRSRTYQASSTPTPGNKIDTQFFSHYPVRRLQAEELMDAIAQVTGVPDRFANYPLGTRAIELSDTELPSLTLDTFGRPVRTTPCECDRSPAPSMSQALDLFNGETLQNKLKSADGFVAELVKSGKTDAERVEELFLRALARRPGKNELEDTLKLAAQAPSKEEGMQDVLWALINSKEFMFNH